MRITKSSFSLLAVINIVAFLVLLGVIGYVYYKKTHNVAPVISIPIKDESTNPSTTNSTDEPVTKPVESTNPKPMANTNNQTTNPIDITSWANYSSTNPNFKLRYPNNWTISDNTNCNNGVCTKKISFTPAEGKDVVLELNINDIKQGDTLDSLIIDTYDNAGESTDTKLSGIDAKSFSHGSSSSTLLINNGKSYEFVLKDTTLQMEFDQILSTFKL